MKESFDTSDKKIQKYELGFLKNKQSISSQEISLQVYQRENILGT